MDSLTSLLVCLLCTLSSVSSQPEMSSFIGGDVLLPCIYSGSLPSPISAFWRDKDDNVVLDIINGKEDKTDAKFKGRVLSDPRQYQKGNFSVLITDLRADDAGPYNCYIPSVDYEDRVTLRLREKPAVRATPPPPAPTSAPHNAAGTSSLLLALLSAPLLLCSVQ